MIEDRIKELPPELRKEVEEFVEFLLEKRGRKRGTYLRQGWAGALRDLRDKYTSVELQHKVSEWRIGGIQEHSQSPTCNGHHEGSEG
jgi:predicted DNA-binding protein